MNTLLSPLKDRLLQGPLAYKLYQRNKEWKKRRALSKPQLDMVYKLQDLTPAYYQKALRSQDPELEHQIGRLINFKAIMATLSSMPGNLIEFGTWRGFSLLWIAYFIEREGIFNKKIVGLDSFEGLPYSDGEFRQHAFATTSLSLCRSNLLGSKQLYKATKKNILIDKFHFKDTKAIQAYLRRHQLTQFCFIHIDCDVSQSFLEIWDLLITHNLMAPQAYLLFDDYGCESNLQIVVDRAFAGLNGQWEITPHSETKLTKNFLFTRK